MFRAPALLFAAALTASGMAGGAPKEDFHLTGDQARTVYAQSVFAHGYRHGYEEGFHVADTDVHMGRAPRTITDKNVPDTVGYKREYGSKEHFRRGYTHGFMAGYADSYAGRPFHTLMATEVAEQSDGKAFDEGFMDGFSMATQSNSPDKTCTSAQPGFCEGFRIGFDLAVLERHSIQQPQVASARKSSR